MKSLSENSKTTNGPIQMIRMVSHLSKKGYSRQQGYKKVSATYHIELLAVIDISKNSRDVAEVISCKRKIIKKIKILNILKP